jgi:tetratricopeptide (TPR) repeat protein
LGDIELRNGQYFVAIQYYEQALEFNKRDVAIKCNKAHAHNKVEQFDEAIKESKESIKIDPIFAKGYKRLHQSMIPLGLLSECRTFIKFGIEKHGLQQDLSEDLKTIEDLINTERVIERCRNL